MAEPPLEAGASQANILWLLPGVTSRPAGAPGTVAGVTELDGDEAGPVPTALVAVTVKVYLVPLVRPLTVALVAVPLALAVIPPGDEVTGYPVIGDPPLEAGATQGTVAWALPAGARTAGGGPGGAPGGTALGGGGSRAVRRRGVGGVPVAVALSQPGDEVTVYPLIWDPPLEAGAVQVTVAWALPAVAVTAVGAPGGPMGMTALEAVEAGLVPTALVAVTVKV